MGELGAEIKQQKFENEIQKAIINVLYTSSWVRDLHQPTFKKYNILQQHYNVLRIVRGRQGKPANPSEIIEVMLDKRRDLTRLVDKLVKLELLERRVCEQNRRKVEIFITEKGLQVVQNIDDELVQIEKSQYKITEEEAATLNLLLDKFRG